LSVSPGITLNAPLEAGTDISASLSYRHAYGETSFPEEFSLRFYIIRKLEKP
jgi:hypothetical protein